MYNIKLNDKPLEGLDTLDSKGVKLAHHSVLVYFTLLSNNIQTPTIESVEFCYGGNIFYVDAEGCSVGGVTQEYTTAITLEKLYPLYFDEADKTFFAKLYVDNICIYGIDLYKLSAWPFMKTIQILCIDKINATGYYLDEKMNKFTIDVIDGGLFVDNNLTSCEELEDTLIKLWALY